MKKFISAILAIILCAALAGCNNSEANDTESINNNVTTTVEQSEKENRRDKKDTQTSEKNDMETQAKSEAEKRLTDIDELSDTVAKEVKDTLDALNAEYEDLKSKIDTYDKYLSNTDKMEEFYDNVYDVHKNLCIKMCEYSLNYANLIINSDMSYDDMYDELDELYDNIYDDAGDDIYDGVYDGLLDDMYDDFYDGILDIDYDDIDDYKEWSTAHSDEYKLWSRTRSDVYSDWSDFRSDVYGFWSDMRSALWSDDIERAEKKIEKFQKNIDKLNGNKSVETDENDDIFVTENKNSETEASKGIRPEFKEALDSYEAFFDEYCDIMRQYMENPLNMSLLTKYSEYIEKAEEMDEKLDALDDGEMSDEEMSYYLEVTARVTTKMLEIYQ